MARTATANRRTASGVLTAALLIGVLGTPALASDPTTPTGDDAEPRSPAARAAPVVPRTPAGPPGTWARPVIKARVSQAYGVKGKWAAGHHTGIDLAVPSGTPVRSVGTGKVVFAGRSGDYGKAITIRMSDKKYTLFAHLSTIAVKKGKAVKAGTWLGRSGNTGRTTGPHLHFEVRAKRGYGSDINPVRYLARHGVKLL